MDTVSIDDLDDIYGEYFSQGSVPDKEFTSEELSNGRLFLRDVLPGGFEVVGNSGEVVSAPQRELVENGICVGVEVDLSGENVEGTWKIRFRRGPKGDNPILLDGEPPSEEAIKYALIFS